MTAEEKCLEYEIQIKSMLKVIRERLDELEGVPLDDFDAGRRLAFTEVLEIIKTRHEIIWDMISDK